jgi:outer membrane protein assembly factor BamB
VNNDGKIEIFGASHDGKIYCLSETGILLWSFENLYDREGVGSVSSAGNYYLTDTTKSWCNNSFTRGSQGSNASVSIISGTGSGQTLEISSVESNKIWTFNNWTTTPDSTSTYKIIPKYESDIYYQHCGTLNQESSIWYLYVTGFDGQLVKLKASDGSLIFKFGTKEGIEPFPWIGDINNDGSLEVIISCLDKHVYCLKTTDGSVVWSTPTIEGNDAFINVNSNLKVLIASRDNRVYVLNGSTGVIENYTRDVGGDSDCRPFTHSSLSGFICGSDTGYICKYDNDCECEWFYKAMDATNTSMQSATLNNNLILIQGDQIGGLHFLDTNGKVIKQMCLKGGIEGTPYIEQYDDHFIIYVTTIEGWIYTIKIS